MNSLSKVDLIEKFISEMNGEKIIQQAGTISFFTVEYFVEGWFNNKCKSLYKSRIGPFISVNDGSNGSVFFAEKPWVGVTLDNLEHFFEKKVEKKLLEYKEFYKVKKECAKFYSKINNESVYEKATQKELIGFIKEGERFAQDALAASTFAEALDDELLLKIFKENNTGEEKAKRIIETLKKPSFESISLATDKGILNYKNLGEIQWLFSTYYSTLKFGEIKEKVSLLIKEKGGKKKLVSEVKKIESEIIKNRREIEGMKKNLSEREKIIVDFAIFNMRMRDERIEPIKKGMTVIYNSIKEYAKRIGLDEKYAPLLAIHELINPNFSKKDLVILADSRKGGQIIFVSQKEKIVSSQDYSKSIQRIESMMHKEINASELKGFVANKGFAKGVAKIILNANDFFKFKEGDILVASMTRVEYVPLMKKAGAIITNEGGITCHAAIVARELKKPCIIGTRVATKVLKDGDMIEVNANTGIVRKIK